MSDAALDLTKTGVTLGVGAQVVGAADPTGAVPGASAALGSIAGFLPVTGSILGAGAALGELDKLGQPFSKKRKRKR